jgi:lactate 2-monooxygenase
MSPPEPIVPGPGRIRQNEIYRAGVQGRTPTVPTDFATLERRARRRARKLGWAYAAGGAGDGLSGLASLSELTPEALRRL